MSLRPESGSVPDEPGSYQFKDQAGRIIYVGKAKSLRSRLNSYFQDARNLHPRTLQMLETAASVEWIEVALPTGRLIEATRADPIPADWPAPRWSKSTMR